MHVRAAPGRPRSDHALATSAQHNHYVALTHTRARARAFASCPHYCTQTHTPNVCNQWAYAHDLAHTHLCTPIASQANANERLAPAIQHPYMHTQTHTNTLTLVLYRE